MWKKTLKILLVSGMIVSLGSLILPSRFWNSILKAESIPPCDKQKLALERDIKYFRANGKGGLADEVSAWYAQNPNGKILDIQEGKRWLSPEGKVGVPSSSFVSQSSCLTKVAPSTAVITRFEDPFIISKGETQTMHIFSTVCNQTRIELNDRVSSRQVLSSYTTCSE